MSLFSRHDVAQAGFELTVSMVVGTEMVEIYVGPKMHHFQIHKNLLYEKVLYFDMMFHGGFKEAKTNSVVSLEDSRESFDLLLGKLRISTI